MNVRWDWLETFLAAASSGSFTAAAHQLGISQPTISRRVQQLEEQLGATLFVRHARGLVLTERGGELLEAARHLDDQVRQVLVRAAGLRQHPEGTVRVSTSEPVGVHVVTPWLAELGDRFEKIRIELLVDNRPSDLSRRQADVAVRMVQPRQADLIAKRVGQVGLGIYAHRSYLERFGRPRSVTELKHHRLVGFDQQRYWLKQLSALGLGPNDFFLRTDHLLAQECAVRTGVGIGVLQRPVARLDPELECVLADVPLAPLSVWLVAHQELRSNAAVRAVFDALVERLVEWCEAPA